jgi:16S rRNA (guanine527-N7)-methyltransferase
VLTEARVRQLLAPLELKLTASQVGRIFTYLDLLERWNQKINLTGVRDPEACVTRHFGESLYLARWVELDGRLLDIGSGAGFPGLALKIAFPALAVTLLEPIAKKRAFLKEVVRTCEMRLVEVMGERLEDFARRDPPDRFDTATARAVGRLDVLVSLALRCLNPGGRIILWLSEKQASSLIRLEGHVIWDPPIPIPLSHHGVICCGSPKRFT